MKAVVAGGAEAIILELNTSGGGVGAGFRLSKAIENSKVPVVCVVDGEALSMGAYLLESCSTRIMTRRSSLMFHQPAIRGTVGGTREEFQNIAELLRTLESGMIEHLVARMNISAADMQKKIEGGKQWWMTFQEALETGAVDCAVGSTKEVAQELRKNPQVSKICR